MAERRVTVMRAEAAEALTFPWGTIRWLCNDRIDPEAAQTFGLVTIAPGEGNPLHYHPNCEELLFVLSGECNHSFDDQVVRLSTGALIRVPAGVRHNAVNIGTESLQLVVSFSSGDRQTVMVEER